VLLLPPSLRILLAAEPVDLRKSIDGLGAIVRTEWKEDLFAGHFFVFVSRRGAALQRLPP
jgi:transposase